MDLSYLTLLPQFQKLSEDKKLFLIQFASQKHDGDSKNVAGSLMQAITLAKNKNISFTQDESSLLIQVLKQQMTKEEADKADKMIQMLQMMQKH